MDRMIGKEGKNKMVVVGKEKGKNYRKEEMKGNCWKEREE